MQHLAQFKIAGFSYYEGAFVFRKLKNRNKIETPIRRRKQIRL